MNCDGAAYADSGACRWIRIAAIIVWRCRETCEGNLQSADQASLRTTERPPDALQAGQPAPLFSLPDADMETVDLGQFRGKKHVVLYFYPKDGTPNCTLEATDFSDHEDEFSRHDCVVLGVSPDDCLCHAGFRDQHAVSIRLLADTASEVATKYAVAHEKQATAPTKPPLPPHTLPCKHEAPVS